MVRDGIIRKQEEDDFIIIAWLRIESEGFAIVSSVNLKFVYKGSDYWNL